MKKTSIIPLTALLAITFLSCLEKREKNEMPNIVFIMADDMGYGDVHCYNADSKIPTPNMDRLAEEGIRFTDAHTPSAVCSPTRYGVLTGRYSWRTVMKDGVLLGYSKALIEPERMTVASMLREHGYYTACVGKWHLGWNWKANIPYEKRHWKNTKGLVADYSKPFTEGPLGRGFDYYFGMAASMDMPPYCFIDNNRSVGIPSVLKTKGGRDGLAVPGWDNKQVGPTFTGKAVDVIKNHVSKKRGQPLFLYVPLAAPHGPCTPPDFIEGCSGSGKRNDMICEVDWSVGQILKALDEAKLTDNTLVIVTSDNGATKSGPEHKRNGDLRGRKADIYDGGHRVPFIARWPGKIKPNSASDELVELTDLMATCAAIVGGQLPANAAEDSYNILPALLGKRSGKAIREASVHHSHGGMFAIRQGKWKLVIGRGSGGTTKPKFYKPKPGEPEGQLYDIKNDPKETTNLWAEHPQIVRRLSDLLEKYKKQGHSRPIQGGYP